MANMNIRKPKFFTDHINFLLATGTAQNGNFDIRSGSDLIDTLNAGSEAELFDMRPMNQVHFETSGSTSIREDHVLLNLHLGSDFFNFNCDFIAILNHNMKSAEASLKVSTHNTNPALIQAADMGSATALSGLSEVVNADTISSNLVRPATDGSTIFTFTPNSDRYWGLQFGGTGTSDRFNDTYDLKIGCIMVGESYTMPFAPDLELKRTIIYDGVSVKESMGGQRFGNASHIGRRFSNARSKSPFSTSTYSHGVYGGRIAYDLSFSFLQSTDLMPSVYDAELSTSDTVVSDVWNRTKGNLLPFIFCSDSTDVGDDAEQSYIFSRFGQNSLDMQQVAPDVYNVGMRIEEEF